MALLVNNCLKLDPRRYQPATAEVHGRNLHNHRSTAHRVLQRSALLRRSRRGRSVCSTAVLVVQARAIRFARNASNVEIHPRIAGNEQHVDSFGS